MTARRSPASINPFRFELAITVCGTLATDFRGRASPTSPLLKISFQEVLNVRRDLKPQETSDTFTPIKTVKYGAT